MASACVGQTATQFSQATQRSRRIIGFGQSDFFIFATVFPESSRTAEAGQIRPQAPHSMHRDADISCLSFFSPEMAETGHCFRQAPQPVHNSDIEQLIKKILRRAPFALPVFFPPFFGAAGPP